MSVEALIIDMKKSFEAITKWLRDSGLKVNDTKTEICLFHRNDQLPIQITVNNVTLVSTLQMKVLGVIFDSKLKWAPKYPIQLNRQKLRLMQSNL